MNWMHIFIGVAITGLVGYALAGDFAKVLPYAMWLILFAAGYALRWVWLKLIAQYKTRNGQSSQPQPQIKSAAVEVKSIESQSVVERKPKINNVAIVGVVVAAVVGLVMVFMAKTNNADKPSAAYFEAETASTKADAAKNSARETYIATRRAMAADMSAESLAAFSTASVALHNAVVAATGAEVKFLEAEQVVMKAIYAKDPTVADMVFKDPAEVAQ